MIDDPIYQDSRDKYGDGYLDDLIEMNNGRDIFIITKPWIMGNGLPHQALSLQYCDHGSINCHFMIISNGGCTYSVRYKNVSRSECLDFIKDNYPGHFEWLLFHPEWTS